MRRWPIDGRRIRKIAAYIGIQHDRAFGQGEPLYRRCAIALVNQDAMALLVGLGVFPPYAAGKIIEGQNFVPFLWLGVMRCVVHRNKRSPLRSC